MLRIHLPMLHRKSKKAELLCFSIKKETAMPRAVSFFFSYTLLFQHGLHECRKLCFICYAHGLASRMHGKDRNADIHRTDGDER